MINQNRFIQFAINQEAAPTRRTTHTDGKEYLIAPTVAVVEGVMNELLYQEDEITAYIDAWNGKPLVFGHPIGTDEEDFISANSPDIFAQSPGYFFNATFDDNRLKGEWWIDLAKAEKLGPQANDLIAKLEAGEIVEQSTGLFTDVEEVAGEFGGEYYEGVARNIRPDHIAILLDDVGACSIQDGCGTPRVNAEADPPLMTFHPPKEVNDSLKSIWTTFLRALGFENNQQQDESINQDEGEIMDRTVMIEEILQLAAMKGWPLTMAMLEAAGDEELAMLLSSMTQAEVPDVMGEAEQINEDEVSAAPVVEQPVQPVPVMPVPVMPAPVMPAPAVNADDEEEREHPTSSATTLALPQNIQALMEVLDAEGGVTALQEMFTKFKATANDEIDGLISLVTANSSFSETELTGLPVEHLRRLATNVCQPTPDYSGRGGGRLQTTNQQDEWSYGWDKEVQ